MPGVLRELAEHTFNIDPKFKPVRQFLHRFNEERCKAIGEEVVITHKYRGSQQFSIIKSVEPNEELKAEQIFPQVLSTTDTTLRTLDVRFT